MATGSKDKPADTSGTTTSSGSASSEDEEEEEEDPEEQEEESSEEEQITEIKPKGKKTATGVERLMKIAEKK